MPIQVTCSACQSLLEVDDDYRAAVLTCPRCLAEQALPGREAAAEAARRAWLAEPGSGADREATSNLSRSQLLLILLAIPGALGIGSALLSAYAAAARGRDARALLVCAIGLVFLMLVSGAIMFWRTRHDPSGRGLGRLLLGTFALAGFLMILSAALALAAAVFVFALCYLRVLK